MPGEPSAATGRNRATATQAHSAERSGAWSSGRPRRVRACSPALRRTRAEVPHVGRGRTARKPLQRGSACGLRRADGDAPRRDLRAPPERRGFGGTTSEGGTKFTRGGCDADEDRPQARGSLSPSGSRGSCRGNRCQEVWADRARLPVADRGYVAQGQLHEPRVPACSSSGRARWPHVPRSATHGRFADDRCRRPAHGRRRAARASGRAPRPPAIRAPLSGRYSPGRTRARRVPTRFCCGAGVG